MTRPLASQLSTPCVFVVGTVLAFEEVERRIRAQRDTVRALGLAVPSHVAIREQDDAPVLTVERLWL